MQCISSVTYRIQRNNKSKSRVVHFDKLKPYTCSLPTGWKDIPISEPIPVEPGRAELTTSEKEGVEEEGADGMQCPDAPIIEEDNIAEPEPDISITNQESDNSGSPLAAVGRRPRRPRRLPKWLTDFEPE